MRESGKFKRIRLSKGSRGAADIHARSIYGPKVLVQVKSGTAAMHSKDKVKLSNLAKREKGVAIYTHYNRGKIKSRQLSNYSRLRKHKIRI